MQCLYKIFPLKDQGRWSIIYVIDSYKKQILKYWDYFICYYSYSSAIQYNFIPQLRYKYNVILFVRVSAKFGTCTVMSVNGTLVEDKMFRFKGECAHFWFNKCPIYTHDSASSKYSNNSHETNNCVRHHYKRTRVSPVPGSPRSRLDEGCAP